MGYCVPGALPQADEPLGFQPAIGTFRGMHAYFIVAQHITKHTIIFAARPQKPAKNSVIEQEIYLKIKHANILTVSVFFAEREALEPTLSRNIIKLQITDNHILSKVQSKSKSF